MSSPIRAGSFQARAISSDHFALAARATASPSTNWSIRARRTGFIATGFNLFAPLALDAELAAPLLAALLGTEVARVEKVIIEHAPAPQAAMADRWRPMARGTRWEPWWREFERRYVDLNESEGIASRSA